MEESLGSANYKYGAQSATGAVLPTMKFMAYKITAGKSSKNTSLVCLFTKTGAKAKYKKGYRGLA